MANLNHKLIVTKWEAFGGTAKKTFKDGPEEKVESFFGIEDASDDLTDCENEEPLN